MYVDAMTLLITSFLEIYMYFFSSHHEVKPEEVYLV